MKTIVLVTALLMCIGTMVNAGENSYESCIETHEDAYAFFSVKDFNFMNVMEANGASMDVRIGAFALMKSEGRIIDTYKMRFRDESGFTCHSFTKGNTLSVMVEMDGCGISIPCMLLR